MDIKDYLNQDKTWFSADGAEVDITSMSSDHAHMAARWLTQNSTGLILIVEASKNEDAVNGTGNVQEVLSLVAQSPRAWIQSTMLFRALDRKARGR